METPIEKLREDNKALALMLQTCADIFQATGKPMLVKQAGLIRELIAVTKAELE